MTPDPTPDTVLRLQGIIDEALAVDFDVTDEPGSLTLAAEKAPSILALVNRATSCLIELQEHYEGKLDEETEDSFHGPASLDDIGAMISAEVAAQEILDLAFIALAQVRLARGRLETAIDSQNLLAMVTRADSALTRLRRECIPLESAVFEYEGLANPMRVWADLEVSLEIRRVYANLRRSVLAVGEPRDEEIPSILGEFQRRFASLGSNPIYPRLRIADRVQLQTLSRRIGSWLSNESDRDTLTGRRIWSDLSTYCYLLAEISKRQELMEHDRQVVARAYHTLFASVRPPTVIPVELLEDLHTLEGLDDDLDRLIQHGTSRRPADWETPLSRLYRNLDDGQAEAQFL